MNLNRFKSSASDLFVVSGASRGLGLQLSRQLLSRTNGRVLGLVRDSVGARGVQDLLDAFGETRFIPLRVDLNDQMRIEQLPCEIDRISEGQGIRLLLNVAAVLGDGVNTDGPEKSLSNVNREWLGHSFATNVTNHVMLTKALLPTMAKSAGANSCCFPPTPAICNLSARVGSIGDNRLGGWFSYRMSKAALNQFTKTTSIQLKQKKICVISLHPGTVNTDLSKPFQRNVAPHKLFSVEHSADCMLKLLSGLSMQDTGKFFAYDGSQIPW